MYSIYGLHNGDPEQIRYIGLTGRSLELRLQEHVSDAVRNDASHKHHWIQQSLLKGISIYIRLLDTTDTEEKALRLEELWITVGKKHGLRLTNTKEGGHLSMHVPHGTAKPQGPDSPRWRFQVTDKTRGKLSEAQKAAWARLTPERQAERTKQKGRPHSDERREEHSRRMKELWASGAYAKRSRASERG